MKSPIHQQPRYIQLAQTLISEIEDGAYKIGELMPTEFELCAQFGVSRFTVREAIKRLVAEGMVTRQAGVGTRIVGTRRKTEFVTNLGGLRDIDELAGKYSLRVTSRTSTNLFGELAQALDARDGQLWLRLDCLREDGGKVVGLSELFIHPAFRSLEGLNGRVAKSIYSKLEQQFGEQVAEVRQSMSFIELDAESAKSLGLKRHAPAVRVSLTYVNRRHEPILMEVSTYPADRFKYSQVFSRQQ